MVGIKHNYSNEFMEEVKKIFPYDLNLHRFMSRGRIDSVGARIISNQTLYEKWLEEVTPTTKGEYAGRHDIGM